MFVLVSVIIIILISKFTISKKDELPIHMLIGLSLIVAGGVGNLIDRIIRGFVVDFIDFSQLIRYPIFNIADIYIVIGCIVIGINMVINTINDRNK